MAEEPGTTETEALERKLSTILSADVAEYSRLMAEDEEATLRSFRGHRKVFDQLVALHRGRIFNTAGDAILVEFGSAVEAVRCATEIQAALRTRNDQTPPARQVRFRIGVNLGDVMVHGTDLLGDGVNIAARLQAAAAPGGICISGSVYDQIRNKLSLTFNSLGEQSFKNIPQPVRTFSIAESEGHAAAPRSTSAGRGGIGRTAVWLVAAALLVASAGGYWVYREGRHDKAEPARPVVEAETTRHEVLPERQAEMEQRRALREARREAAAASRQAAIPPPASSSPVAAVDGVYGGSICYAAAANDPARCFRAQATLGDGRINGRWLTRESTTMILEGVVAASGAVQIEMHTEHADGSRFRTIVLSGSLRDGRLEATGAFLAGRKVDLNWQRQ